MKFERVRPGEYRAQLAAGGYVWVVRLGRRNWVWFRGGYDSHPGIWADADGFSTLKEAKKDAVVTLSSFPKAPW